MTAQPQSLPIVVGVDGSANGDRALDWAVRHAIRAQRPLRIVHVPEPSLLARLFPARRRAGEQAARQLAQELVDSRVARARAADAALDVVGEVVSGPRDACLEQESRRAELMVVGSRGLSGTVESLVTGSATTRLVLRASCPVVVVPEGASRTSLSRVVAGTDASQQSRAAVDLAFTLSRTWQARLRVVLAWDPSAFAWLTEEDPSWPAEQTPSPEQARTRISGFLTALQDEYPDVALEWDVVPGAAIPVLVAESDQADLLVVGSHGRGHGIMEVLQELGSVSYGVLRYARCPVAVVPQRWTSTSASSPAAAHSA